MSTQIQFTTLEELQGKLSPGDTVITVRHDTFDGYKEGRYKYKSVIEKARNILQVNKKAVGIEHQIHDKTILSWLAWPAQPIIKDNTLNILNRKANLFSNETLEYTATYIFYTPKK